MSQPPHDPLQQGVALHGAGRLDEARRCYEQVLALQPHHPDALHLLGLVEFQTGAAHSAIERIRRAIRVNGRVPMYHANMAAALAASGRGAEAQKAWRRALDLDPRNLQALTGLAGFESASGRKREAAALYGRAAAEAPGDPRILNNQGIALLESGAVAEAIEILQKVVAAAPGAGHPLYNLGNAYLAADRRAEARACYDRAAGLLPGYADLWVARGRLARLDDDLEGALVAFRRAAELAPSNTGALSNAGNALMGLGRLDEAEASFRAALAVNPDDVESLAMLAQMGRFAADDPALARAGALANSPAIEARRRATLHFALGAIHDRAGRHDPAFGHFARANAVLAAEVATADDLAGADRMAAFAEEAVRAFTPERFARQRAAGLGHPSDRPIFVLGLPRSGTTLVEQILASHPEVYGAGELTALREAGMSLATALGRHYPELIEALTPEAARTAAGAYLERLGRDAGAARRVVDKMPANFADIGLIALILPRARIVHCRRDLMDVGLSCFMQNFGAQNWASSLERIALYIDAYRRLMAHWRELGIEMLDVDYEAMVADQEAESRRLVAFCGLDWDDRCLAFHRTARAVTTASVLQVRQPIYRSSVGRWRAYKSHLRPLRDALGLAD